MKMVQNQKNPHFSKLPHNPVKNSGESGIAYVAILFILVILSSLGLAFIMKVGTETVATMNRGKAMQAQYLAESAANHALWRMLNEPGFPAAGNVYYMHSLAGGRYGYKVRAPTLTTFATVATVGAMGDNVVTQGYVPYVIPSNVMAVYSDNQNNMPDSRRLVGASLSNAADTLDMGLKPFSWVRAVGCPKRKEVIMGTLDANNDLQLAVWRGTAWGNKLVFNTVSDSNFRTFDIAYENLSGDAVAVGWTGTNRDIAYTVWNGFTWSPNPPQLFFTVPGSYQTKLLIAASKPGKDNILVGSVDDSKAFRLFHWNGNSFADLGVIEANMQAADFGIAEIVFEQQSGEAIILWSKFNDPALYYCTWSSSAGLSAPAQLPAFNGASTVIRVAADRTSDHIFVATVDKFTRVNVAVWNGTTWIDSRKSIVTPFANTGQVLDVAWEDSGDEAVVAWTTWFTPWTYVDYFTWRKGTTLASRPVQQGPAMGNIPDRVRLMPIYGTEKMLLLSHDQNSNLFYNLWTGNRFAANSGILLNNDIGDMQGMKFDIAEALVPTVSGGGGGNSFPVVNAGTDTTIMLPTDTVALDGTVTDDGLPNPPATFTTLWTKTSGTGTVTFGDTTQIDTTAQFATEGEYVLRLTADDSALTNYDEVTITVSVDSARDLLFVVADKSNLSTQEINRKTLMEGWGYKVKLISDDAPQAEFNSAVATAEGAYVPVSVDSMLLGTKLNNTTIGVVNELQDMIDDFGFGDPADMIVKSRDEVNIMDNSHYIVSVYPTGLLPICTSLQTMMAVGGASNPDLQVVAWIFNVGSDYAKSLVTLETGTNMWGGGTAPGRRVKLPWGDAFFNVSSLNNDGKNIMKRSIDWAAGLENKNLLFVVSDPASLSTKSSGRKTLFESWGYSVALIDDNDTQANFESAAAACDVVYVSPDVSDIALANKLTSANKGIVNELPGQMDNFGFCSSTSGTVLATGFTKTDALHYITSPYGGSAMNVFSLSMAMSVVGGNVSPGIQNVGEVPGNRSLVALNTGAFRWDTGTVPARRAHLPFSSAETSNLTTDGETIMLRAIEWASGMGDGTGSGGGGSIIFAGFTEAKRGSNGTSITITKPPGTAKDDLLIAAVVTDGLTTGSLSAPAGWNLVDVKEKGGQVTIGVWWKIAGSSAPVNYQFTWTGSEQCYGWIMRFTGHNVAGPIDTSNNSSGISSSPASASVSTNEPNCMILRLGGFDDDDITVDSPGLSGHAAITMDKSGTGNFSVSGGAGYVIQAARGASDTSMFSLTASEEFVTMTISIKPAL